MAHVGHCIDALTEIAEGIPEADVERHPLSYAIWSSHSNVIAVNLLIHVRL